MTKSATVADSTRDQSQLADRLRGFGPLGILSIIVILLTGNIIGTAFALLWARLSRTPWRELGVVRPRNVVVDVTVAATSGVVLKILMKAVVMRAFAFSPVNQAYHFLVGSTTSLPSTLAVMIVGAGFGEETIWRGFLFERLRALIGTSTRAAAVTVVVTSLLFGMAHLIDQGWPGVVQSTLTGFVFGLAYLRLRRIWPVMVAHAAFDVTAVLLIYWDMEEPIARALLR